MTNDEYPIDYNPYAPISWPCPCERCEKDRVAANAEAKAEAKRKLAEFKPATNEDRLKKLALAFDAFLLDQPDVFTPRGTPEEQLARMRSTPGTSVHCPYGNGFANAPDPKYHEYQKVCAMRVAAQDLEDRLQGFPGSRTWPPPYER